jgi:hypothetical protein
MMRRSLAAIVSLLIGAAACSSGLSGADAGAGGRGRAGAAGGGAAGIGGAAGTGAAGSGAVTSTTTTLHRTIPEYDILFMIDNSSSMTTMQQKLLEQLPTFMQALQNLPMGLPSLHVGVVSSDMGAPSDSQIGCTALGDDGAFHYQAEGTCTSTTLTAGSTFISDVSGMANFTDPIGTVFQCIALLGASGCGFEHQLASIDRALGADGLGPAPSTAAGFLRPEAYLGIVMLTNEDDASAPDNTTVFSLNGFPQNLTNPDGPLTNYRQNGGPRSPHLCQDPASAIPTAFITEPLAVPSDAQGSSTAPTLNLTNCKDNDSGSSAFYPVAKFVSDIKALKPDPDNQILVAGIFAPPNPVEIGWYPPTLGQNTQPGELWPAEMHSCGPQGGDEVSPNATQFTTDESFGDPGIRLSEFVSGFSNSVQASICDPSYAASMTLIANKLGQLATGPCITGAIRNDLNGNPTCTVVQNVENNNVYAQTAIHNCNENGNVPPCWTLQSGGLSCAGSVPLVNDTATNLNAQDEFTTFDCTLCVPNAVVILPGC